MDKVFVCDLMIKNCVGVDSWSRCKQKQPLRLSFELSLDLETAGQDDTIVTTIDYGKLCSLVTQFSETHEFRSLEGFALATMQYIQETFLHLPLLQISICVEKPRALLHAGGA
ncbi:trifunctional dihydropteroate synthetase, partial [Coelomomyces lativittatus]